MRRLILLGSAFVTLAVGGSALAAQAVRENPRSGVAGKAKVRGGLLNAAAVYLELSPADLRAEIRAGESLGRVATMHGKSVDGLRAVLVNAFRANVEAALISGRLDTARAQRLIDRAPAVVERLVQRTPQLRAKRVYARGGVLRVAGDYLGLSPKELVYELRNGTSLADLARARNRSVEGLEAALLAAFEAKVAAAVSVGRLDAAQAHRLLKRAPAHIAKLVNRSRG